MMNLANPRISVAIPTHEMQNGDFFFRRLLDSLWTQSFQNFEIVVTDNSDNDTVKDICEYYLTGIRYFRNPNKGMAVNSNAAIMKSRGDIIKILYMDDYLLHKNVLASIISHMKNEWLIMGADNNPNPYWTDNIETGNNKLGSPSALAIKNDLPFLFDPKLTWLLDCDLYKRYFERSGEPDILGGRHIGIGIGEHQLTNLISAERKLEEREILIQRYG